MKLTDNIREKVGDDKLLHFLLFALIVAFGFLCSGRIGLLAFYLMLTLSIAKECLDDFFNWKDLLAGVLGGMTTLIVYFITSLL